MTAGKRHPALLLDWLTPVYDLFIKLFMPEVRFKRHLIAGADIGLGYRVLDIGAGTGTLGIMIKQNAQAATITCIDGDLAILRIAHKKAARARVDVTFKVGDAAWLPYPAELFNRVL